MWIFYIWCAGALIYGVWLSFRAGKDLARAKIANPQQGAAILWSNVFWEMMLWFYFPVTRIAVNVVVAEHNKQASLGSPRRG